MSPSAHGFVRARTQIVTYSNAGYAFESGKGAVMRIITKLFLLTSILAAATTAATAQSISDNIVAQLIIDGQYPQPPAACYNGEWTPKPSDVTHHKAAADPALKAYLTIAAGGGDISPAFVKRRIWRDWRLDGIPGASRLNLTRIRDPWASKVARLHQTSFTVGNSGALARSVWNAYAADGTLLGTYDALLRRSRNGAQLQWLYLYSPAATAKPNPVVAFCLEPGDVERWHAVKARLAAEKAAKQAAKEAARAARQ